MPAIVVDDALGLARGAGGVEDIEGIGGEDRHAVARAGSGHRIVPVGVAAGDQRGGRHGPLQDDAMLDLVGRHLYRAIEQGLVIDYATGLDAAGGADDDLGLAIVDAHGQLVRGEAAEDHGMHGTQAGAGIHGDQCLGHHGHVDDDPVTLAHAPVGERAGEKGDFVAQLGIGEGRDGVRDGAVVDEGRLISPAALHMAVEGVVAGVGLPALEPAIEGRVRIVEHPIPAPGPVDGLRRLGPEGLGLLNRLPVGFVVPARHRRILPPRSRARFRQGLSRRTAVFKSRFRPPRAGRPSPSRPPRRRHP